MTSGQPALELWGRARGGTHYHHWLAGTVFRGGFDLIAGEVDGDALRPVLRREMQRAPVDHHLAAADAEESAEVDHRRASRAVLIDQHLNDVAHVLAGAAVHRGAENGLQVTVRKHRLCRESGEVATDLSERCG